MFSKIRARLSHPSVVCYDAYFVVDGGIEGCHLAGANGVAAGSSLGPHGLVVIMTTPLPPLATKFGMMTTLGV